MGKDLEIVLTLSFWFISCCSSFLYSICIGKFMLHLCLCAADLLFSRNWKYLGGKQWNAKMNQICFKVMTVIQRSVSRPRKNDSDLWQPFFFFFFFFFAFPSYISGVHHFWVRFLRMWPFFNPTIKVVTFRLRGWCMLGVFLLPAFTRLGHERQDLLSPCDEMHVCTD